MECKRYLTNSQNQPHIQADFTYKLQVVLNLNSNHQPIPANTLIEMLCAEFILCHAPQPWKPSFKLNPLDTEQLRIILDYEQEGKEHLGKRVNQILKDQAKRFIRSSRKKVEGVRISW